jgi:hypothetical protein
MTGRKKAQKHRGGTGGVCFASLILRPLRFLRLAIVPSSHHSEALWRQ